MHINPFTKGKIVTHKGVAGIKIYPALFQNKVLLFKTDTLVLRQAPQGSYVKPQYAITASSTSRCWIIQVVPNLAGPKPNTTQRL